MELTDELKSKLKAFQEILDIDPQQVETLRDWEYVPISVIEDDLNELFFGQYDILIKEEKQIFNGVMCFVDIIYVHPVTGRTITKSGSAAVTIYSELKKEGTDQDEVGLITTLEMAVPLAYAEAIKNGVKKIGKRFGADLNREYTARKKAGPSIKEKAVATKDQQVNKRILHLIEAATGINELNALIDHLPDNDEVKDAFNKKLIQLTSAKTGNSRTIKTKNTNE